MADIFSVPILFIIFNRLETAKRVFEEIKNIRPKTLFISADGPRQDRAGEYEKCEKVRNYVINNIDWGCEVKTLFREKNSGCKLAVSSALDWFFTQVEQGIILEDDCLPDQSFFPYCEELLNVYKDNKKVFMISGNNYLIKHKTEKESYYFSHLTHVWGWASWRRAWDTYDISLKDYPEFIENKKIEKVWNSQNAREYWLRCFNMVYENKLDTWDYQWTYNIWNHDGVSVAPNVNLVSNIGYGSEETHGSAKKSKALDRPLEVMNFPLIHPKLVIVDQTADDFENKYYFLRGYSFKKGLKKMGIFKLVKWIYKNLNSKH
jgi:hypothetical protein